MSNRNTLSTPLNIVAVSGGLNSPSKTESLVQAILDELSEAINIKVHFVKLSTEHLIQNKKPVLMNWFFVF